MMMMMMVMVVVVVVVGVSKGSEQLLRCILDKQHSLQFGNMVVNPHSFCISFASICNNVDIVSTPLLVFLVFFSSFLVFFEKMNEYLTDYRY